MNYFHVRFKIIIFILFIFFIPTSYAYEQDSFDLIVDTDMAIDDWSAILYMLNQTQSNVLGFTIAASGEAHCAPAQRNLADLVYLAGREEKNIPITCGDSVPMEGFHTFPDDWRKDMDILSGIKIPQNPNPLISSEHSVEWLHRVLLENSKPVVIFTSGPLTNIGQLLQKYPKVIPKIKNIYMMGGAVHVKGNLIVPPFSTTFQNIFAEWNIWVDPLSAKIVFQSGIPIILMPLDATNKAQVTRGFMQQFNKNIRSKSAQFYADVLEKNLWFIDSGEYYFWDVLAASMLYNNICIFEDNHLDVVTKTDSMINPIEQMTSFGSHFLDIFDQFNSHMEGRIPFEQIESGRTMIVNSKNSKKVHSVCVDANKEMFMEDFIRVIND